MYLGHANKMTPMVYAVDNGQIIMEKKYMQLIVNTKLYIQASGYANYHTQ